MPFLDRTAEQLLALYRDGVEEHREEGTEAEHILWAILCMLGRLTKLIEDNK